MNIEKVFVFVWYSLIMLAPWYGVVQTFKIFFNFSSVVSWIVSIAIFIPILIFFVVIAKKKTHEEEKRKAKAKQFTA